MTEKQSSRIFVVGFIGSDRKGLAQKIAAERGYRYLDLDREIEAADGRTILRICMMMGEHEYRNKEYEMLSSLCFEKKEEDIVIACGDGVLFDDMCREILEQNTILVADSHLTCDQLWQKAKAGENPPYAFWLDPDETERYQTFCRLYEQRKPIYEAYLSQE